MIDDTAGESVYATSARTVADFLDTAVQRVLAFADLDATVVRQRLRTAQVFFDASIALREVVPHISAVLRGCHPAPEIEARILTAVDAAIELVDSYILVDEERAIRFLWRHQGQGIVDSLAILLDVAEIAALPMSTLVSSVGYVTELNCGTEARYDALTDWIWDLNERLT